MEGRWVRLAVSAHYDKAIDFSEVSQEDVASLAKESVILDECERRKTSDYLHMMTLRVAASNLDAKDKEERLASIEAEFQQQTMPWLYNEKTKEKESEDLQAYYNRIVGANKQRQADKNG